MFIVNMTFISSSEVKKCIFHECRSEVKKCIFHSCLRQCQEFLSENFQFLVAKVSIYLNRHVFVIPFSAKKGLISYFQTKIHKYRLRDS